MDTEKKTVVTSVNLPVESIFTIIDVDNPKVEVGIEAAEKKMKSNSVNSIYSLNTQITINRVSETQNTRSISPDNIEFNHTQFQITKIERKKIDKTNDLKFFKAVVDFSNGIRKTFVVPSFVKFYSSHRGTFIPVEFIRNRDILLDYTGNICKIADAELIEDFKMTDFYNINVVYDVNEINQEADAANDVKHLNESCNFYLNGILSNISYNNFQKKD